MAEKVVNVSGSRSKDGGERKPHTRRITSKASPPSAQPSRAKVSAHVAEIGQSTDSGPAPQFTPGGTARLGSSVSATAGKPRRLGNPHVTVEAVRAAREERFRAGENASGAAPASAGLDSPSLDAAIDASLVDASHAMTAMSAQSLRGRKAFKAKSAADAAYAEMLDSALSFAESEVDDPGSVSEQDRYEHCLKMEQFSKQVQDAARKAVHG